MNKTEEHAVTTLKHLQVTIRFLRQKVPKPVALQITAQFPWQPLQEEVRFLTNKQLKLISAETINIILDSFIGQEM